MARFLFGIALMLSLFLGGLWLGEYAENIHTPVTETLQAAAEDAGAGNAAAAAEKARLARELWYHKWHQVAAFSDHAPMDEIDGLFAQIENSSGTELAALCRRIASLVSAVAEAHALYWWNLL